MPNWLLPENIADVLPSEARKIEELRRQMLDTFRLYGYELVMPPLLEYVESLLAGAGQGYRPAHLQAGRPAIRPPARPARRHDDPGRAHRRPPAEPRLGHPPVLRRQRAAYPSVGPARHPRAAPDRRRDLRPRRPRSRRRDPGTGAGLAGAGRFPRSAPRPAHVGVLRALLATTPPQARDEAGQIRAAARQGYAQAWTRSPAAYAPATRAALLALPNLYGDVEVLARARDVLPALPGIAARWPNWPRWPPAPSAAPKWRSTWPTCAATNTKAAPCSRCTCPACRTRWRAAGATTTSAKRSAGRVRPPASRSTCANWRAAAGRRAQAFDPRPVGQRARAARKNRAAAQGRRSRDPESMPGHENVQDEFECDRVLVLEDGNWILKNLG
jgi:ATP phosphoribosyltransferase regulatory subunit